MKYSLIDRSINVDVKVLLKPKSDEHRQTATKNGRQSYILLYVKCENKFIECQVKDLFKQNLIQCGDFGTQSKQQIWSISFYRMWNDYGLRSNMPNTKWFWIIIHSVHCVRKHTAVLNWLHISIHIVQSPVCCAFGVGILAIF